MARRAQHGVHGLPGTPPRWSVARRRDRGQARPGRPIALGGATALAACTMAGALIVAGPAAGATASAPAPGTPVTGAAGPGRGVPSRPGWLPARPLAAGQRPMTAAGQAAALPVPGFAGAVLYSVSCTEPAACTATGMSSPRRGGTIEALAEQWNGRAWAVQSPPTPLSGGWRGGTLNAGVSCMSPAACVAAGYSYSKNALGLLGESWNGRRWTVQPVAAPHLSALPYRISCAWRRDCMVVGMRPGGGTLAEHWNGTTWAAQATPSRGALMGVSCPTSRSCTAVGFTLGLKSLAEHWNGTSWSPQSAPSPKQLSQLQSVSCRPAGDCVAVGTAGSASDLPLAERYAAGKWSVLPVPDPGPAGSAVELESVSCTSATDCMAVGDYSNAGLITDTTVAVHWNGASWRIEAAPSPTRFSVLLSVSCTSAAYCVAVGGTARSAGGAVSPLTETWNGITWSVQAAPR